MQQKRLRKLRRWAEAGEVEITAQELLWLIDNYTEASVNCIKYITALNGIKTYAFELDQHDSISERRLRHSLHDCYAIAEGALK